MFVVDTNILIYAADKHAPEHSTCHKFVQECRQQATPWYLTWGIVYEFLRVTTHPRVFQKPLTIVEAWQFMNALLVSPSLRLLIETDRHTIILQEVIQRVALLCGNLIFDARTATLMKEHGIKRIYSRDTDFHRFDFLEVVDPVK